MWWQFRLFMLMHRGFSVHVPQKMNSMDLGDRQCQCWYYYSLVLYVKYLYTYWMDWHSWSPEDESWWLSWSTDFSNRHLQVKAFMYRHLLIYHNIFRCIYTVIHCPQWMNPCDLGASVTFPLISPFVVLREFIPTAIAMKFWKFMIPRGWLMGTLVTFLTPPAGQNVHVQVSSEISKNLNFRFSGRNRKCLFS